MSDFINQIAIGNAIGAKNAMSDMLSAKAFESLDARKQELAASLFGGDKQEEQVEQIDESDLGNGYKVKMKHIDKGRIHSPSGEHVADVTRHESGWQYHSGNSKWDGTEKSPHYKTGVEKTKMAAAKKAAQIHMNEQVELTQEDEQLDELSKGTLKSYYKGSVESGMKAQHRATNTSMGGSDSEHKKNIADINKRVSGQDAVTKRLGSKETMSMDKEAGVSRLAGYKPTKPNPKKYSE